MLSTKKIKAFTIAELLVVLVLTSIVVSLALVVLNLVQKQISGIQINLQKQNEIQVLEKALWKDLNSNKLFYNPKKEILICTNPTDSITYSFGENFILRNLDTIDITVQNKYFYMDGEIVYNGAFDALEIELSQKFQNKSLFIFQKKDVAYYMNRINNNTRKKY
ncbi:MAG: hypothetical protein KAH72_00880 [Flavobacteriaceae bacterium]|nr:hypothetical protein [Flavobacteriaceae bacterium]